MDYKKILTFWFQDLSPSDWYKVDPKLDEKITFLFSETMNSAISGELFNWRTEPQGRLAEIIVLDQFSRNMFRNTPKAFSQDPLALILAQEAVIQKADTHLSTSEKNFIFMPYMHSESKLIHQEAVKLFSQEGLENGLNFENKHKKIIDRFGRYPHRNNILNRVSTDSEIQFLKEPNSSF